MKYGQLDVFPPVIIINFRWFLSLSSENCSDRGCMGNNSVPLIYLLKAETNVVLAQVTVLIVVKGRHGYSEYPDVLDQPLDKFQCWSLPMRPQVIYLQRRPIGQQTEATIGKYDIHARFSEDLRHQVPFSPRFPRMSSEEGVWFAKGSDLLLKCIRYGIL